MLNRERWHGMACGTHRSAEKCVAVLVRKLEIKGHLGELSFCGRREWKEKMAVGLMHWVVMVWSVV